MDNEDILSLKISNLVSKVFNKNINDIMVIINKESIFMNKSNAPSMFIDFMYLGIFDNEIKKVFCNDFLQILIQNNIIIESSRIYINFSEIEKSNAWKYINNIAICPNYSKEES